MRDTVAIAVPGPSAPQTGAELLLDPRTLPQHPEQPDQPHQHTVPADTAGLAATIRGPLAPELYDAIAAIVALQRATSSSSSAMDTTPAPSASTTTATATAGPSASTTAATAPATASAIPRTTAWRHKLQEEQERRAREEGQLVKPFRRVSQFNCRRCGQPKTKEYGHSRYKRETFCSRADGGTVEQWLKRMKDREREGLPPS